MKKHDRVICPDSGRVICGSWATIAGSRYKRPIDGYRAVSMPNPPIRATRAEAIEDERLWLLRQK